MLVGLLRVGPHSRRAVRAKALEEEVLGRRCDWCGIRGGRAGGQITDGANPGPTGGEHPRLLAERVLGGADRRERGKLFVGDQSP